jgi:hypothetical protein
MLLIVSVLCGLTLDASLVLSVEDFCALLPYSKALQDGVTIDASQEDNVGIISALIMISLFL